MHAMLFSRFRHVSRLLLIAGVLLAGLLACLGVTTHTAIATRHSGGNGPEDGMRYAPPAANAGAYVWGAVFIDGQPVSGATLTMAYGGQVVTATTLLVPQIEPFPIYMFDALPATQLGVRHGSLVTITASVPGHALKHETVRVLPDRFGELAVHFTFGQQPPIWTTTPPLPAVAATDTFTTVVIGQKLDVGYGHSCVIANGVLKCWGSNLYGETGDGTRSSYPNSERYSPVNVVSMTSEVRAVATGAQHTCAVLQTGKVKCWGYNYIYGAAGPAIPTQTSTPTDVPGIDNAIEVVSRGYTTCVLLADRRVLCWGGNDAGQLGNGTLGGPVRNATPSLVVDASGQPLANVTALAAGAYNVCAIVAGGVTCWGAPSGLGGAAGTFTPYAVDVLAAGSGIVDVGVGANAACAVRFDGAVACWGIGMFYPVSPTPVQVTTLPPDIVEVALSQGGYNCALRQNGEVLCWGSSEPYQQSYGQLGISATQRVTMPVTITGISDAVDLALGLAHACARLSDGGVRCWGADNTGALGDGADPLPTWPWTLPTTATAVSGSMSSVSTGGFHSCGVTAGGEARCWGANNYGQLGLGYASHAVTQALPVVGLPNNIVAVSAGFQHTCALTNDGAAWCWGRGDHGELGSGSAPYSSTPVSVTGLASGVMSIAASGYHSCAILATGEMRCWGSNWAGQLGHGDANNYYGTPQAVVGLAGKATAMSLGDDHTCAIVEGGAVQCWGLNDWGQLGRATAGGISATPATVTGLTSGATAIAAGRYSSCAVVNGGAQCWGGGGAGQLGDGVVLPNTTHSSTVPINVYGLTTGVFDIETGSTNGCVIMIDGTVRCWGSNWTGQMGTKDSYSTVPVTLTTLPGDMTQVDIEYLHGCARSQAGTAYCWGDDTFGQLGNGVSNVHPEPVTVVDLAPAKWTYMLYLAGDNDLSYYFDNIARTLNLLPQSTELNVVILFDGQGASDNYLWSTRDGLANKWQLSEQSTSMGDAQTLARFIAWAQQNYPAEHYYLSLANHGRGTSGIGWDTQNGGATADPLTPSELRTALETATRQGSARIDVLHFDACLMALAEVAYQVKDYADYMIGSENLTAAFYPYDEYAQVVLQNPAITPRSLATQIADIYFDHDYLRINNQPRTISVLDLAQSEGVRAAIDGLATVAMANMDAVAPALTASRNLVQVFDASPDYTATPPKYYTLTPADEYVDLYHFAELLRDNSTVASVSAASQQLLNVLNPGGFVVHTRHASGMDKLVSGQEWGLDNSHGVAIFFPLAPGVYGYDAYVGNQLFSFTGNSQWDEFLAAYYTATQTAAVPAIDPGIPPVLKPTIPIRTHCAGIQPCLWGTVSIEGVAMDGATVTLEHANGSLNSTTAVLLDNEANPIYRLALNGLRVAEGDRLTLKVQYGALQVQREILFSPYQGEQEVNFTLDAGISEPPQSQPVPVEVVMNWATVSVSEEEGIASFTARASSNDGAEIIAYRWTSNLAGSLGSTGGYTVPLDRLPVGEHTVTVVAVNANGIESTPATLSVVIPEEEDDPEFPAFRIFLPSMRR